MSSYYDLELIDVNEVVQNFTFEKVSSTQLDQIKKSFRESQDFLEFDSLQGSILLERKFFRGLMYVPHNPRPKSTTQETIESMEFVGKINVDKKKPKVVVKE